MNAAWDGYDVTTGTRALMGFVVDDLSNWYVRLNRARFWAVDGEADPEALATLQTCLVTVSRLLAPAAPFLSDWIHRGLVGSSVHLARFPEPGGARDEALETAMDAVRRLASLARAVREEIGSGVRQPLARMIVAVPSAVQGPVFTSLLGLLGREVNVKAVEIVASDADLVTLRAKPNFRSLGKRYGTTRFILSSTIGIQLALAYLLTMHIDGLAAFSRRRRLWQGIFAVIILAGGVSCALRSQSDTWWKWGGYTLR